MSDNELFSVAMLWLIAGAFAAIGWGMWLEFRPTLPQYLEYEYGTGPWRPWEPPKAPARAPNRAERRRTDRDRRKASRKWYVATYGRRQGIKKSKRADKDYLAYVGMAAPVKIN